MHVYKVVISEEAVVTNNTQQPPFYGHYTGQPALAGAHS